MKIVEDYPPNIAMIEAALGPRRKPGTMFCYGETIYNPSGRPIPEPLIIHEGVHSARQQEAGVDHWWARYVEDAPFRFDEETIAHMAEVRAFALQCRDRASRRIYARDAAKRLSGPLYGNIASFEDARAALRIAARVNGR